MAIDKKKFKLLVVAIVYAILIFGLSDSKLILANLLITISLIWGLIFVYDTSQSIFCVKNIFYVMFFGIGFYVRYLVILIDKSSFMSFAPRPLQDIANYHTKTAAVLLAVIITLSISYRAVISKKDNDFLKHLITEKDIFDNLIVKIVYFIFLIVVMAYKFINASAATNASFGNLDNLFNSITVIVQLLAYTSLAYFVKTKKKSYMVIYLFYFVPIIAINIINMWKSGLLFEIIILCIAFHNGITKVKKKYIIICIVAALIAFPVISMLRDNDRYNSGYDVSVDSIIEYNIENNVFKSYSERMAYYDETYYCLNTSPDDIKAYQDQAGGIISRFFAGIVPRAIWKNKPIVNSGKYITYTLLHYPSAIYNNLTVGLISDCYLSYSYIGIIIILFIFGRLLVNLEKFKFNNNGMYAQGVYLTIGRVFFTYMEGDIAAKTLSLLIVIIAMICLKILTSLPEIRTKSNI